MRVVYTPHIYRGYRGRNYRAVCSRERRGQGSTTGRAGQRGQAQHHTQPRTHHTRGTGREQGHTDTAPQPRHRDRETGAHRSRHNTHHTQKKEQVRTQSDIEVCYSSSVEHKGTDHTVAPNHSTCSPQRGHGTRHQSLRCVLFCVQAGHGIAVGTTQTQNVMRGEEGAAFLPIK